MQCQSPLRWLPKWRCDLLDACRWRDTYLPLPGCLDGPETATTAKVEHGRGRGLEVVEGEALAAVGDEHVVPVIAGEGSGRGLRGKSQRTS